MPDPTRPLPTEPDETSRRLGSVEDLVAPTRKAVEAPPAQGREDASFPGLPDSLAPWTGPSLPPPSLGHRPTEPDGALGGEAPNTSALFGAMGQGVADETQLHQSVPKGQASASEPAEMVFEKGRVVFDNYLIEGELGQGGMGAVYLVKNLKLNKLTALKVIKPEGAQREALRRRFSREAEVMAKIQHPSAVNILRYDWCGPTAFIEMEYVKGRTLKDVLKERRPKSCSLEFVRSVLEQLCDVLEAAHQHVDEVTKQPMPIIHRDLKPANIMIAEGRPPGRDLKVLDFGIAKVLGEPLAEQTMAGHFFGTLRYASPEQQAADPEHQPIDARSDLYSVGVIAYEMLVGTVPPKGPMYPIVAVQPHAQVPPELEAVLKSCTEIEPAKRPQTSAELKRRLLDAVAAMARRQRRRRRLRHAAIGAVPLALLLAGGIALAPRLGLSWPSRTNGTIEPPPPGPGPQPPPPQPKVLAPEGYAWEKSRPDLATLVRSRDGVLFDRSEVPGVYLPRGHEPKAAHDLVNGWPRVVVRAADQVEFIRVPGGTFERGCWDESLLPEDDPARPAHRVRVDDFYIQAHEVTNREVQAYSLKSPGDPDLDRWRDWRNFKDWLREELRDRAERPGDSEAHVLNAPAVCIDHAIAREFARDHGGRLPTEAEWEFAARSGGELARWATSAAITEARNLRAHLRSSGPSGGTPRPVATMIGDLGNDQTEQGVRDMTGNVREWCLDLFQPYRDLRLGADSLLDNPGRDDAPATAKAGQTPKFVVRGGSFEMPPARAYTFHREGVRADERLRDLGFRLVLECPPLIATD